MAVNEKELRRYLNVIERSVTLIKSMMDHDDDGVLEQLMSEQAVIAPPQMTPVLQPVPQTPVAPVVLVAPVIAPVAVVPEPPVLSPEALEARRTHLQALRDIDCWPEAVGPYLVGKKASDEDQVNRANSVLDMMVDRSMEGKAFLDFGCGEGWITQEVVKRGVSEALGYDIKVDAKWGEKEGAKFTNEFSTMPHQHFDFVMLYDVLDHCEDPVDVMAKVRTVLKPEGTVFVRCHPWTSRHATHLYKQGLNRAYWHMFLSWDELKEEIKDEPMFTRPEKDPVSAYRWWFNSFSIEKERLIQEDVSEFFLVSAFKELLASEQQMSLEEVDGLLSRMRIQFADYVISLK